MLNKQPHPPESPGGLDPVDAMSDDVLDAAAIARLVELDPTGKSRLLERVLRAFQTSAARLRPQLDAARQSGDSAAIRLVVHTLKSSSASIGALRLSQLCAQIETSIRLREGQALAAPLGTFPDAQLAAPLDAMNIALDGALRAIDTRLEEQT